MEYRVDAFRKEGSPGSERWEEPRVAGGRLPARRSKAPAILRGIGLVAGLPIHLAAMLLLWPIARLLRAAGVNRAWLERLSRTLAE